MPSAGQAGQHRENGGTFGSSFSDALSSTRAYFSPFTTAASQSSSGNGANTGQQSEANKILAEVAPHIMRPRILNAAVAAGASVSSSTSSAALVGRRQARLTQGFSITSPGRSLVRIGGAIRQGPITSNDLRILEASDEILLNAGITDLPDATGIAADVSLLRGFQATVPSALEGRSRRRKARAREGPKLGLKAMGEQARGLLTEGDVDDEEASAFQSKEARKARRANAARGKEEPLSADELMKQNEEIMLEKENINVRRMLINSEISEVEAKIAALEKVKRDLNQNLLGLKEEELELNDEFEGINELLALQKHRKAMPGASSTVANVPNSRRRKGPLFLPSEHDELPSGVAFMTLTNHTAPITGIDFSEPYGTLVSSSLDETVRIWDLSSGDEVGRLRGHQGTVKCLQVEGNLCITGSTDSTLRLWDLERVDDYETRLSFAASGEHARGSGNDDLADRMNRASVSDGKAGATADDVDEHNPCLRTLEGHSKSVTCLYFDDNCLVTGASDKTLRQWDLNTGQCVLTMDILWAISNPSSSQALSSHSDYAFPSSPSRGSSILGGPGTGGSGAGLVQSYTGAFAHPTPPAADGSWEMYQDFVGGVQFWGYALASGSGDGGVRMWDSQAHRTLLGHTAPVTCLQFDETHVISGSLDKSIRIWDLRTGAISDTVRYDYPVTALQFDSRKIMAATGENGIKIFNRTTLQHASLTLNGHTSPAERLRYMDRYAVSGGKDSLIKVWSL